MWKCTSHHHHLHRGLSSFYGYTNSFIDSWLMHKAFLRICKERFMCVSRKEKQMSFEKVRVFVVSNLTKKMTQQKSLPFSINQLKKRHICPSVSLNCPLSRWFITLIYPLLPLMYLLFFVIVENSPDSQLMNKIYFTALFTGQWMSSWTIE